MTHKPAHVGSLAAYQMEVDKVWDIAMMEVATPVTTSSNAGAAPFIPVNSTSGSVTITLPPAALSWGRYYIVKKLVAANTVTLDGDGSETIDGSPTLDLTTQYAAVMVICDGSNWHAIGEYS